MSDPFDWPMPSRKDLMSLQSINKRDVGTMRPDKMSGMDFNLQIRDIEGSAPCMKPYQFTNKPDYQNTIDDIAGTRSRVLIRKVGRDGFSLNCSDLKGAHPQLNKFVTTRPATNPVDPVYKLPTAIPIEPLQPKFIRDQINIDDIPGTKPNPPQAKLRKQVHIFEEVEGSKTKPAFMPRDHMEIMDVKDINEYRVFKSTRVTNPMEPEYDLAEGKYGNIQGSKSRILHPQRNTVSSNLKTRDLDGCYAGAISDHFLMRQKRTQYRAINEIKDVPGAQPGTLKKGLDDGRGTNPLNPQYQLPGRNEIYCKQDNLSNISLPKRMLKSEQGNRAMSVKNDGNGLTTAQRFDQFINK